MFMVIGIWENAAELADMMKEREQEFLDRFAAVRGFVSYNATFTGHTLTAVTVCKDQAATQESTRVAGELVKKYLAGAGIGAPKLAYGHVCFRIGSE
jgi:hypothetical protein